MVPTVQEVVLQFRSGLVCRREILFFLPRFELRTFQAVANRYPGLRRLKVLSNCEQWLCIQHTKTAHVQISELSTFASYNSPFQLQGFYKYEFAERSQYDLCPSHDDDLKNSVFSGIN